MMLDPPLEHLRVLGPAHPAGLLCLGWVPGIERAVVGHDLAAVDAALRVLVGDQRVPSGLLVAEVEVGPELPGDADVEQRDPDAGLALRDPHVGGPAGCCGGRICSGACGFGGSRCGRIARRGGSRLVGTTYDT